MIAFDFAAAFLALLVLRPLRIRTAAAEGENSLLGTRTEDERSPNTRA